VANANIAAELLIKGQFLAKSVKFIIAPSFRKAFSITDNSAFLNAKDHDSDIRKGQNASVSNSSSFLLAHQKNDRNPPYTPENSSINRFAF
jgi:hypothetical protein